MNIDFKVTIVIPVKNGSKYLEKCLHSIQNQKNISINKIILLYSNSYDSTLIIASKFGAEIIIVESDNFNHGLTRNIPIATIEDELIFFTVQDAFLSDDYVLEKMAKHFQDSSVKAVCGHQAVPKSYSTAPFYWYNRKSIPKVVVKSFDLTYQNLTNIELRKLYAWDNVVSMYRRSALLELNFRKTNYCEDWIWCKDALSRGWNLIYDPSVVVYHYHEIEFLFYFKSRFTINHHLFQYLNLKPVMQNIFLKIFKISFFYIKSFSHLRFLTFYWLFKTIQKEIAEFIADLISISTMSINSGVSTFLHNIFVTRTPQGNQIIKKTRNNTLNR
jgi:rhamnosyltransferase